MSRSVDGAVSEELERDADGPAEADLRFVFAAAAVVAGAVRVHLLVDEAGVCPSGVAGVEPGVAKLVRELPRAGREDERAERLVEEVLERGPGVGRVPLLGGGAAGRGQHAARREQARAAHGLERGRLLALAERDASPQRQHVRDCRAPLPRSPSSAGQS